MFQQHIVLGLVQKIMIAELGGDFGHVIQLVHKYFTASVSVYDNTCLEKDLILPPDLHYSLLLDRHLFIGGQISRYQLLLADIIRQQETAFIFQLNHGLDFDPLEPRHQVVFAFFSFVVVGTW